MTIGATQFATGDSQTVKLWSDRMDSDFTTDGGMTADLIKKGVLVREDDLSREAGDQVKVHFLGRLSNPGFQGDASSNGLEQALTHYQDSVTINEIRNVVKIPGKGFISSQRVTFDLPENSYQVLKNWAIERVLVSTLNQLAGNAATSITYDGSTYSGTGASTDTTGPLTLITGNNSVTNASTNQIIRANSQSTDTAVGADTTAKFNLGYIIQAENMARKNRPYIQELSGGSYKYLCILHTDGYQQLVEDTTFAIQFRDIYLNMIAGGKKDAMMDNQSFAFSQTLIVVTDKIPYGQTSGTAVTTTRRAIFCGAEAGSIAFGKGYKVGSETTPGWSFQQDALEGGKWVRHYITGILGVKKAIFNSIDRGTIAIVHYVA